jgi:hypothetical protein
MREKQDRGMRMMAPQPNLYPCMTTLMLGTGGVWDESVIIEGLTADGWTIVGGVNAFLPNRKMGSETSVTEEFRGTCIARYLLMP